MSTASIGGGTSRRVLRWTVLVVTGTYLLVPLLAMLDFSTQGGAGGRSLDAWRGIGTSSDLLSAIWVSLQLALLTVVGMLVLLVPTVTWVHLRLPRVRRLVEFLCLLPLTIPAIVLVVGLAPIYAWVSYFLGNSPLTLAFAFVVLTLPFSYRAIDAGLSAIDIVTLAEAARSLGASWTQVLLGIVVPTIRGALMSASVISVALVLGEFTISSLLSYDTLQVVINLLGKRNAQVSVAVSLGALVFAFLLLFVLANIAPRRGRSDRSEATSAKGTTE